MSVLRRAIPVAGIALVLAVAAGAGEAGASAGSDGREPAASAPAYPGTYAFVDVNVVPMDRRTVLRHQTVLVRDGVIRAVADTGTVEIPADAVRIQGSGRYLLPGLGDMYARLPTPEEAADEELEDLLFLYLAHGVTTVRQGPGRRGHLTLASRIRREQVLGPTLYVSSPPLQTGAAALPDSVAADSVEAAVERMARQRWDLMRVPETMSLREWGWMTPTAVRFGLAFGGPVPDSVGLRRALATGISTVDHLDGLLEAVVEDRYQRRIDSIFAPAPAETAAESGDGGVEPAPEPEPDSLDRPGLPPLDTLARAVVRQKVWAVAGRARAASAWMVPTLRLFEVLRADVDPDSLLALPEMRYVSRPTRGAWARRKETRPPTDSTTARLLAEMRREAARALNDLNAGLLVGTDSPRMFNVPGASIHREMRIMEEAGISPYGVLIAATRNVATYASEELRESGRFGTVAEGNRADLMLVESNPLEGLGALRSPAGVMVRGRWISGEQIEERLEAIAARHGE